MTDILGLATLTEIQCFLVTSTTNRRVSMVASIRWMRVNPNLQPLEARLVLTQPVITGMYTQVRGWFPSVWTVNMEHMTELFCGQSKGNAQKDAGHNRSV